MKPETGVRLKSVHVTTGSTWIAEKKYALEFLLAALLGLECEIEPVPGQRFHLLVFTATFCIKLHDSFFKTDETEPLLVPDNLPGAPVTVALRDAPEGELTTYYGTTEITERQDCVEIGPDLVATVFFLLSRWEESLDGSRDAHGRFPDDTRFGRRHDLELRPLVNEYAAFIVNICARNGLVIESKREFAIVPTHDVDRLYHRPLTRMLRKTGTRDGLKRCVVWAAYRLFRVDQAVTFDRILRASDEAQLVSHFYWMAGDDDPHDGYYEITDGCCRNIALLVAEHGHSNGYHPGYRTYRDRNLWLAEKRKVDTALDIRSTESRQHFLRISIPETFRVLEEAGIETDSSLGISRGVGFRCGTGDTFPVFDFVQRETLRLHERPLLVMDAGIRKGRFRKKDLADALRVREACRKYRMPCTILFHNHTLDPLPWNSLQSFYFDFIRR